MKVICNRGALLEALMVAGNVAAARTPKPILQCVKLSASGNELTVSATDLEVAIRYRDNQVEVTQPGEVLVPADRIRDIVRESIDDTLSIESAAEMAHVKGADSIFKIYTQAAEGFPPVPGYEGTSDFEVAGGQLKQLIGQTVFAAARESSRYAFNGVLLNVKGKKLSLVSTDGRRLAEAKGELASGGTKSEKETTKAIIPVKALQMIEKLEAARLEMRRNGGDASNGKQDAPMTPDERAAGLAYLKDPKLTERIVEAMIAEFSGEFRMRCEITCAVILRDFLELIVLGVGAGGEGP